MADDPAAGPAAVADLGEERDVAAADVAGDLDLLGGLHRVAAQGADLRRVDAGVGARRHDDLAGELGFRGLEVLGKCVWAMPAMAVASRKVTAGDMARKTSSGPDGTSDGG